MTLTVIIACRNEETHLLQTIAHIRRTAPSDQVELIIVDDASDPPIDPCSIKAGLAVSRLEHGNQKPASDQTRFFRNVTRKGVAQSRHLATGFASGEWLLLTDAHMIFPDGWFERFQAHASDSPKNRLLCSQYFFLRAGNSRTFADEGSIFSGQGLSGLVEDTRFRQQELDGWKLYAVEQVISGARFFYYDRAAADPGKIDVISYTPIADNTQRVGLQEIPCVIGAGYFLRTEWFQTIGGMSGLEGWSCNEWALSVKTWLCGGDVQLMNDVHLGHILHPGGKEMDRAGLLYNKLVMAYTTLPDDDWRPFCRHLPPDSAIGPALQRLDANRAALDLIRGGNLKMFTRDAYWLCEKFNIGHPADLGATFIYV